MNATRIGQRVRARRLAAEKTQQQLADSVGLHKNTIGAIERGEAPSLGLRSLIAIAKALGVRAGWFLS